MFEEMSVIFSEITDIFFENKGYIWGDKTYRYGNRCERGKTNVESAEIGVSLSGYMVNCTKGHGSITERKYYSELLYFGISGMGEYFSDYEGP